MALLFSNNASGTLANTLNSGDTSLVLSNGEGAAFPSPSGSDVFYFTVEDDAGNYEVCYCTARAGDTLTIVREQDGTTAQTFTAGARVELRVNAAVLDSMVQKEELHNREVNAGNGLTGGGSLDDNVTITMGTPGSLSSETINAVTATSHTHQVDFPETPIPSGTVMLFRQSNAPTGWTKLTTFNDRALRVVSGSIGTGGSVPFATAFASKAVAGTVESGGAHTHGAGSYGVSLQRGRFDDSAGDYRPFVAGLAGSSGSIGGTQTVPATGISASGGAHTHTFTGTAINLAVQYVDVILATKN